MTISRAVLTPCVIVMTACALLLAGCVPATPKLSQEQTDRAHPLQDKIWSAKDNQLISPAKLTTELQSANYILLGELHDNPSHHALQAWVVRAMVEKSRRMSLVVEMIAADQTNALKIFYETPRRDSEQLRLFLDWDQSGWPDFAMYAPIFRAALLGDYPIVAGNLDRTLLPALHKEGWAALSDDERKRLRIPQTLPEATGPAIRTTIATSHCNALPEKLVQTFSEIQFARDATLAEAMRSQKGDHGALLIAGLEHVRGDRGVPWHLRKANVGGKILSVAFIEVEDHKTNPADYDDTGFDILWFTPALPRVARC